MDIINTAFAAETGVEMTTASWMGNILMWVGFIVIFYFLFWRPQSKRTQEHRNLINSLAKNDEVVTSGGVLGKVVKVSDDFVILSIADNIEIKCQKTAISTLVPKGTFKSIN